MKKKLRIGIVFGGRSSEHEVSLLSARSVIDAIDRSKYGISLIAIAKDGRWFGMRKESCLLNASDSKKIALDRASMGELAIHPGKEGIGPVDVVFNNAGYGLAVPLEGITDEQLVAGDYFLLIQGPTVAATATPFTKSVICPPA